MRCLAFPDRVLEPSESFDKSQWDFSSRPIALFSDQQFGLSLMLVFLIVILGVVLWSDQQSDYVRVLLYGSRFAKIAEPGFTTFSLSGCRFNWATTMIGIFSSLAKPFIPPEISVISICRLSDAFLVGDLKS
jgi:hypothetical protein